MKKNLSRVLMLAWLLIPATYALARITALAPTMVEQYYSNGLNRSFRNVWSQFWGIIPFSVAEFLIFFAAIIFLSAIAWCIHRMHHSVKKIRTTLSAIATGAGIIGILYFVFFFTWGMNYSRQPFSQSSALEVRPSSISELRTLCDTLIDSANSLEAAVKSSSRKQTSIDVLLTFVNPAFQNASSIYPVLSGAYSSPKSLAFPKLLSWLGLSGYYFPFTAEANVNSEMPKILLPSTSCHEAAHLRGFAREDEANYIAYAVCLMSDDIQFRYSGIFHALIYSMSALYTYDPDAYQQLHQKYSSGLLSDLRKVDQFWSSYEGPADKISSFINNTYLKANMQRDGVNSYGRMVDLLLAAQRSGKLLH